MVGARGFEPPTPCSRSRCATRLRYAPLMQDALDCPSPRHLCKPLSHSQSRHEGQHQIDIRAGTKDDRAEGEPHARPAQPKMHRAPPALHECHRVKTAPKKEERGADYRPAIPAFLDHDKDHAHGCIFDKITKGAHPPLKPLIALIAKGDLKFSPCAYDPP